MNQKIQISYSEGIIQLLGVRNSCVPKIAITTHRILLAFTLLHLLLAAVLPLMSFEAHYALYGYYLQLSYVDHPPLMGWLQGLAQLVNSSELALRIVPILIALATQYTLIYITLKLYPQHKKIDVLLAGLLQLLPISHIVFTAAPDLPLALFSCLGFLLLLEIVERDSWAAWLGLGLCFGLAGLSKYTAGTLVLSLPLALGLAGRGWRWILTPKPWLAGLIAVIIVSPVLIWNLENDWLSFRFQVGYQQGEGGWSASAFFSAIAAQLGSYSPFFILLLFGLKEQSKLERKSLYLALCWSLPILVLFTLQAGVGRTSPHWTYASWLILTPALAAVFYHQWRQRKLWRNAVCGWSGFLIMAFIIIVAAPWVSFKDFEHPLKRNTGWDAAAKQALVLRLQWTQELQRQGVTDHYPALMVYNWHHAELLAWYARPEPVLDILAGGSQFDQWFGTWVAGDRGILVRPKASVKAPNVQLTNGDCVPVDKLTVSIAGGKAQVFHYYRCVLGV